MGSFIICVGEESVVCPVSNTLYFEGFGRLLGWDWLGDRVLVEFGRILNFLVGLGRIW